MRLPATPGVTPVPLDHGAPVEEAADALLAALRAVRGRDAARDPGLAIAAEQTAELARRHDAGLVAIVQARDADPALLVAWTATADPRVTAPELACRLTASGAGITDVTTAQTPHGHPVVIVERVPLSGAQLQIVVLDTAAPRLAVFTLHSPGGRGWLDVARVAGEFVTRVRFGPGTPSASSRRPSGTSARSAPG